MSQRRNRTMTAVKYRTIEPTMRRKPTDDELNALGADGWELVCVTQIDNLNNVWVFVRPAPEPQAEPAVHQVGAAVVGTPDDGEAPRRSRSGHRGWRRRLVQVADRSSSEMAATTNVVG